MLCTASVSVEVVQVAWPATKVSPVLVPLSPPPVQVIGVASAKNCTLPAGGPVTAVWEATVAVNATGVAGGAVPGGAALSDVVVFDLLTTCGFPFWPPFAVRAVALTALKFVSPL